MFASRLRRWAPTRVNLWFDLAIFLAALFAPAVFFTGKSIHEWLGIGLATAIIAHLLLHWQWLVQVTRRFFGRMQASARLNYVVNSLFFVDMTIIIFTGLMISEVALPFFGIQLQADRSWRQLHVLASDLMAFILAAHVALHWKWIGNTGNRYLLQPLFSPFRRLVSQGKRAAVREGGAA